MKVTIQSKGPTKDLRPQCLGEYRQYSVSNGRPVFKKTSGDLILHWNPISMWKVSVNTININIIKLH